MSKLETKELKQTRGTFKLSGKVKRIDNDKAYRQDEGKNGKKKGVPFRSLKFSVQTSENNEVRVEAFSFRPDYVFLWNSVLAKKEKENGGKYKGERVPYSEWKDNEEEYREKGYVPLESRVGLSYDESGKLESEGLPLYVAIDKIFKKLENGDDVHVEGEVRHSTYTSQDGKEIHQTQYAIKRLFLSAKPINFDADDFEEVSYFEEEIVYVGSDKHPDSREKLVVVGRTIDYQQKFLDNQYVIDATDDKEQGRFGNNVKKKMKFGDKVVVFGNIVNRVEIEEVEETEDDFLASLGGKSKPKHAQSWGVRNYVQEMVIVGIDSYEAKFYTENDFLQAGFMKDESDNDSSDSFGGKSKPSIKNEDPFADEDPFSDDGGSGIDSDELPF